MPSTTALVLVKSLHPSIAAPTCISNITVTACAMLKRGCFQGLKCHDYILQCSAGVTKAIKNMNKRLNLPSLQKIMMEFERESEIMDLKEETISDTIDDVIGEGDDEEVGGRCL